MGTMRPIDPGRTQCGNVRRVAPGLHLPFADEADTLALNPTRLALAGISSGAAIIAGTALRCRDTGGPSITLQILLTPMLRHREPTASRRTYGQGGFGITTALASPNGPKFGRSIANLMQ
jgi:hypothetical protein